MITTTVAEVATATGGTLAAVDPATRIDGPVVVDSRLVRPDGLFVARVGAERDGHDFAQAAIRAGAVAVLAQRPVGVPAILVDDSERALGRLARAVVDRLGALTVVGVTGSSGKTTTKDLLAAVLEPLGPLVAPQGSYNTEVGVPLTVLDCDAATRILIVEMGARGLGHIAYLCQIAPPRIGVVLGVGSAHLGEFGDRATIARAKAELVQALPAAVDGGWAVLNVDDPAVRQMAEQTRARVLAVGESAAAQVRAEKVDVDGSGRAAFHLVTPSGSADVALRLVGRHQVGNALAAAAVAHLLGMTAPAIAARLGQAEPRSRWRMEVTVRADGVTVVNDAYNANPESMRAALRTLAGMDRTGRAWAVLGEMRELGEGSAAEHEAIGRFAAQLGVDRIVAVSEGARGIHSGAARERQWHGRSTWVPDVEAALTLARDELTPGDLVLVKSSHAAGLRVLGDQLAQRSEQGSSQ